MGEHVKGIMHFSFFSLKIYCQTVQRQNARLSQLQIKMSSLEDCIFSEVGRKNYTGLCRNIFVENIPHVFLKLKPTVTFEFVYNIPPTVINCGQNNLAWICRPRVYWCNGSKFDWPMKDMSSNQKKWEFGQALFFVSPTPHYVPRETKIEPDRRLVLERNPQH